MIIGERTTVHRQRSDMRLQQAVGYVWALSCMCEGAEAVPTFSLRAIVDALGFSLEQLCNEHGLDDEGRRS